MACISVCYLACLDIVYAIEHGHKHTVGRLLSQQTVRVCHTLRSADSPDARCPDQRSTDGHEDRCRHTFSAHVCNHEPDVVIIDTEEIVEVSSHVLGSIHRCSNVQHLCVFREGWKNTRQYRLLYFPSHRQVTLDPFQLVVFQLHLLDIINLLNGLFDGHAQVIQVYGLRGEIKRPVIHRLTDVAHVAIGTHHDALQGWVLHFVDFCQQRQPVHLWHVDIREYNVIVLVLQKHCQCFKTVVCERELVFSLSDLPSEILRQEQFEIVFIVYTEDFCWHNVIYLFLLVQK